MQPGNQKKMEMRKNKLLRVCAGFLLLSLMAITGCGRGPMGPEGPAGPPGIGLLQQYSGSFSTAGDFSVDVPEISGRPNTTYVQVYFAVPSAPDIWTPMTDGWKDNVATSRTSGVSWSFGKVYFFGMNAGDNYLIKVYQNQ